MAEIDVTVNDRVYRIACGDGEEEHLMAMADHLDLHAKSLASSFDTKVGEARLMLMAALTVGDELSVALDRVDELEREAGKNQVAAGASAEAMDSAARRIESIAARVKSA